MCTLIQLLPLLYFSAIGATPSRQSGAEEAQPGGTLGGRESSTPTTPLGGRSGLATAGWRNLPFQGPGGNNQSQFVGRLAQQS